MCKILQCLTSKKPCPQAAGVSQATTERDELKKLAITFLKRGDNSHQLPGKRDNVKVKENKTLEKQKRTLTKKYRFLHFAKFGPLI